MKIPFSVKKRFVDLLEKACCLTHPFVELEIKLLGSHCSLASLSFRLDEKWKTGVWVNAKGPVAQNGRAPE